MRGHSVYKVPQGKLLKTTLEYDETRHTIQSLRITGDFFAYPEEAIELLELKLEQTPLDHTVLVQTITRLIHEHQIQFIGLDAEGLTQGILRCVL
ncbi:MAG: hypothetical protein JXA00_00970 [Candidatus Thermoplasmatota archaeon]|nr:hypothetical protein [Candidatus Thermoplasmatota archaeon]